MHKYFSFFFIIFILLIFAKPITTNNENITDAQTMQSISFFSLDTFINLKAMGQNSEIALNESKEFILNFEKLISPNSETSDIYKLNNNNGNSMQVSEQVYQLIEIAVEYAEVTNGIFDPTIASISNEWGIGTQNPKVPTQDKIDLILKTVSYNNIILLQDNFIQLENNATIELGAIAKGYIADKVYEIYQKYNVKSGIISLSGNVYLVGEKEIDTPWNVGITDPDNPSQQNIALKLNDISVVTAGGYERYFEKDGEIYHHIFDTKTGYPTNYDIKSVTVISKNSTLADVLSTTFFAMELDDTIAFLDNYDIDVLIIDKNDNVFITDNIKNSVTLTSKYSIGEL